MKGKEIGFIQFVILVALLMALVSVTINMLLPAFQDITQEFQLKNKNQIHLSISLLYFGLGTSQLVYGSLSDAIGRKKTVYIGLLLFLCGCTISLTSSSLLYLLIGQIIQGVGLGAPRVMTVAIVRDKYEGNEMAKAMSFIMLIYILMPTLSPILGKGILIVSNWRILFAVFILMASIILFLFKYLMPETLTKKKRIKFSLEQIKSGTTETLKNKVSMGYILILGLYSGVFITYLNLSQPIFEIQYELGNKYPLYFASLALSIGLASYINGKLVLRLGMRLLIKTAVITSFVAATLYYITIYFEFTNLWLFVFFMFVQLFSYGVLIGNLNAMAMKPLGHIAGLGASIIGALSTLISVPISIFIGDFYIGKTTPIVIGFLIVGILSLSIINFVNNKKWKTLY